MSFEHITIITIITGIDITDITVIGIITGTIERNLLVRGRCGHIVRGGPLMLPVPRQHPALDTQRCRNEEPPQLITWRPSFSQKMKRGGPRSTSPSCRS
jgi:hypothetical protein